MRPYTVWTKSPRATSTTRVNSKADIRLFLSSASLLREKSARNSRLQRETWRSTSFPYRKQRKRCKRRQRNETETEKEESGVVFISVSLLCLSLSPYPLPSHRAREPLESEEGVWLHPQPAPAG